MTSEPSSDDPYARLGVARNATAAEIRKAYFRLVRVHTPEDDPETFQAISSAYELLSDPEARARFDAAVVVAPEVRAAIETASALVDDDPEQVKTLLRPVANDRELPDGARFAAASILMRVGAFEFAARPLEDLVERSPDEPAFVEALARCLCELERFQEALHCVKQALPLSPEATGLYLALSQVYLAMDQLERADEILLEGIAKLGPQDFRSTDLHLQRVFVLSRQDRDAELQQLAADVAASIPDDDEDARLHVVSLYVQIGEGYERAREYRNAHFLFACAADLHAEPGLIQHRDELERWARGQTEARTALDDRDVPYWIRSLIFIVLGPPLTPEEADGHYAQAVEHCAKYFHGARREWKRFTERYPSSASVLEKLHQDVDNAAVEYRERNGLWTGVDSADGDERNASSAVERPAVSGRQWTKNERILNAALWVIVPFLILLGLNAVWEQLNRPASERTPRRTPHVRRTLPKTKLTVRKKTRVELILERGRKSFFESYGLADDESLTGKTLNDLIDEDRPRSRRPSSVLTRAQLEEWAKAHGIELDDPSDDEETDDEEAPSHK